MNIIYIIIGISAVLFILGVILFKLDAMTRRVIPDAIAFIGLLLSIISGGVLIGSGIVLKTTTECSNCESLSPMEARYCIHCGEELETPETLLTYYCSVCEKEVPNGYVFCPDCGNEIIAGYE